MFNESKILKCLLNYKVSEKIFGAILGRNLSENDIYR